MDLLLLEVMIQILMHALLLNTSGWFLRMQIILLPHAFTIMFFVYHFIAMKQALYLGFKIKIFCAHFFLYNATLNYYVLTVLFMTIV
jgi:hypothetical protein